MVLMRIVFVITALLVFTGADLAVTADAQNIDRTPSPATVRDLDGNLLDQILGGHQVILSKTFVNERSVSQPYVAIFEVRDPDGFTVYLTWQIGTMTAGGRAQAGVSWVADGVGEYQIRTFLLSSLTAPEALDVIEERSITVVEDAG